MGEKILVEYDESFLLGAWLFVLFKSRPSEESLTVKENKYFNMSNNKPYIERLCIDSMATNILTPYSASLATVLKNITISPPPQPVIPPPEYYETEEKAKEYQRY